MKSFLFFLLIVFNVTFYAEKAGAQVVFAPTSSTNQLRTIYQNAKNAKKSSDKLKILIVPGHDQDYWGTEYAGVKEADLNYQMALELSKLLKAQKRFNVIIARDKKNYIPELADYFETQKGEITKFKEAHRNVLNALENANIIKEEDVVYHNQVNSEVSNRLYGINKWSNENEVNLVINIHFNDTPERKPGKAGPYKGFVVYVPNNQFSNAEPSIKLGKSILKQMRKYFSISNMPNEAAGVVEDQKLIALGAANTLSPAAILIEYGYIYRPAIISPKTRPALFKKMATQTVTGIVNFLKGG